MFCIFEKVFDQYGLQADDSRQGYSKTEKSATADPAGCAPCLDLAE
jgi:hypothetical protein